MTSKTTEKKRYYYTGNEVGNWSFAGDYNFVAGGEKGSGISAGTIVGKVIPGEISREIWNRLSSKLSQELLDACFPFMELNWIADIQLSDVAHFRFSDKNIYVEDLDKKPRFYEARVAKAPSINITLGEWLSPKFEISDIKFEINNRDGYFNDYLPNGKNYLQWIGSKVSVKVGFGEKIENYFEVFNGSVSYKQGITTTNEILNIKCYEKTVDDSVEIPATSFDSTNYPNIDSENTGKAVPVIYGDWSEEVGDYGYIPAFCVNALDEYTSIFIFQISENSLREIGDIYLSRGDYTPDKDGPILLKNSAIIKEPENGRIIIPNDIPVLTKNYVIISDKQAGTGSGLKTLVSASTDVDFVNLGVKIGDIVLKDNDSNQYIIDSVSTGIITTTTGTFLAGDNYKIITDKYQFLNGDKITVFCKGKDLTVMSTTRVSSSGLKPEEPRSLSIGLDGSYWFVDNNLKKIYNVDFSDKIKQEINFSDISSEITFISSIASQYDGTIWILEKNLSKVYRYLIDDKKVGLSFTTLNCGIEKILVSPKALTIDESNVLTIYDDVEGKFYRINGLTTNRELVFSFSKNVFEPLAVDIFDLGFDINKKQLLVIDRATNKFFRINPETGALISSLSLVAINSNFTYPIGVSYYIDGTIFLFNKNDLSIYNYNEFEDCSNNIGFICRDLLQAYSGKTTFDFDLTWNETSRVNLSQYKARIYVPEKLKTMEIIHQNIINFNANCYSRFQKYALFQISFDNFRTNGDIIREGDIKLDSFNPSKEFNQYFNVAYANYKINPAEEKSLTSDIYASPSGIKMAGEEIARTFTWDAVYRREDVDKLVPLFVRLASAEPEFVNLSVGFRFLFIQQNNFYNINFTELKPDKKSGRRFSMIPAFTRSIQLDLNTMEIKLKLWSLGTTQFGDYVPDGIIGGGQNDQIILTNLSTPGYIAPVGKIISVVDNEITLEDVDGVNAEGRENLICGKAWKSDYAISIINGETHKTLENLVIDSVVGNKIFTKTIPTTVSPTIKNSAGFIVGGTYIKYSTYNLLNQYQKVRMLSFCKPEDGYPASTTKEVEEQRAKKHSFDDRRLPFSLHPKDYSSSN